MTGHEMSTVYSARTVEYLIALAYLVLFVPFWRSLRAASGDAQPAVADNRGWLGSVADWFRVPEGVYLHPGHVWARVGGGDLVTLGIDDFAQKLVGPISRVALPAIGARLAQGESAIGLSTGAKTVDLLSPVDGTVVDVNERVAASPHTLGDDPYGTGWLVRVRSPRVAANLKQLLAGSAAHRFMEESWAGLRSLMSPALGALCEDGGVPVDGMARSVDPEHWDELARRFLRTELNGAGGSRTDPDVTSESHGSAHGR